MIPNANKYLKAPFWIWLGLLLPLIFIAWTIYITISLSRARTDIERFIEVLTQLTAMEKPLRDFEKGLSTSHQQKSKEELLSQWQRLLLACREQFQKAEAAVSKHNVPEIQKHLNIIKAEIEKMDALYPLILKKPLGTEERLYMEDQWRESWNKAIDSLEGSVQFVRDRQRVNASLSFRRLNQFNQIVIVSCVVTLLFFVILILYRRDIARRKFVEKDLRASEERFSKAFHFSPIPILLLNTRDERIADVNESFAQMTGYSRQEVVGHFRHEFNLWANEADSKRFYEQMVQDGRVPHFETQGIRKDGTKRTVVLSSEIIEIDGEPCALMAFNDITERIEHEIALKKSEERFYKAFISNPYPMSISEIETGKFIEVNESFARYLGYTREELIGRSAIDVGLWPKPQERKAIVEELLTAGFVNSFESSLRNKEGKIKSFSLSATLIEIGGKRLGLGAFVDITESKRTQARQNLQYELTRILSESATIDEAMPKVIRAVCEVLGWEWGEQWRVDERTSNLRCLSLWQDPTLKAEKFAKFTRGVESAPPVGLLGYVIEQRQPVWIEDATTSKHFFRAQLAEEAGLHTVLAFPIIANNQVTDVLVFINKQVLAPDEQLLTMAADICRQLGQFIERKKAEAALHLSEELLQQSQKMEAIGRLAGGVAHDFNNILTAITGYSDLALRRIEPNDPLRRNVEEIKKAALKAATLTNQLLAFSRKQVLQPKTIILNETVANMDQMLRRLIGEDIQFLTVLEPKLWPVKTDPVQIELALLNLAVNARDAMPNGGKMTIETTNVELDSDYVKKRLDIAPGQYVMLAVSDTGHGMDEETQSHLFEPFFTTKPKGKGTGLGLSTVYGIVKQSKGHISFYSEVGRGTTFKVYLPCVSDAAQPQEIGNNKSHLAHGWETILLVEDEDSVRHSTNDILTMCGYKVIEAKDGLDALELCAQYKEPIHLVLTDVIMPRMNGSELVQRLSTLLPHTKILFMSGYTGDAITHHGVLEEGINFIEKPFTPDALARKVREVLG
jgi:PAS domain S-box-containing protein